MTASADAAATKDSNAPTVVSSDTAVCSGGPGASGHPKVYININPKWGMGYCSYCSRLFKKDPNAKAGGH